VPQDPVVEHLSRIAGKSGSFLLTATGWWSPIDTTISEAVVQTHAVPLFWESFSNARFMVSEGCPICLSTFQMRTRHQSKTGVVEREQKETLPEPPATIAHPKAEKENTFVS